MKLHPHINTPRQRRDRAASLTSLVVSRAAAVSAAVLQPCWLLLTPGHQRLRQTACQAARHPLSLALWRAPTPAGAVHLYSTVQCSTAMQPQQQQLDYFSEPSLVKPYMHMPVK
jgi:hypothetical protein